MMSDNDNDLMADMLRLCARRIVMRKPDGLSEEEGKKYDEGKPMMDLLVPEFLEGVARILTYGANKYGLCNWQNNLEYRRIYAAALRHLNTYHKGEVCDKETGESHVLHAACNLMFLYYYELQNGVKTVACSVRGKCKRDLCPDEVSFDLYGAPRCFELSVRAGQFNVAETNKLKGSSGGK